MTKLNFLKHYLKTAFYVNTMVLCLGLIGTLNAQSLLTHHFDDEDLGPFETGNLDRITFANNRLECTWSENDFTGSGTNSKKTEFRADDNAYQFKQEFWTGFWLKVHSDYMATNTNTDAGLMQIWGFDDAAGSANHYAMLKFDGRNGGGLVWYHRYGGGSSGKETHLIQGNFPRNQYVRVIIRVKLASNNQSVVQVWVDDVLKLNLSGLTMGWGDMDANGQTNQSYSTPGSWGMYNYRDVGGYDQAYDASSHYYDGYENNETRTVTFDRVSLWNGTNGYSIVNPQGSFPNRLVTMKKANSTSFAVDGNSNNDPQTSVWLYNYTSGNNNQKWTEMRMSDGYYSYKKNNSSNMCLDCGASGEKCHLWACSSSNGNQLFKKIYVSNKENYVRLQKKTGGKFLDGGNGGANFTQLKVYADQINSSQYAENQQWIFSDRGSSAYRLLDEADFFEELGTPKDSDLKIYPNPTMDRLNISMGGVEFNNYEFFDLEGKLVKRAKVDPTTQLSIDLSDLKKGQYLLRVSDSKEYFKTYKIIKQ